MDSEHAGLAIRAVGLLLVGVLHQWHRRLLRSSECRARSGEELRTAGKREKHHAQFLTKDVGREEVEKKVGRRIRVVDQGEHRPQRLRTRIVEILQQMTESHEGRSRSGERDEDAGDRE